MSSIKKSFLPILIAFLLLGIISSCTSDSSTSFNSHSNPTQKSYDDYSERHLNPYNFFNQEDDYYYVYIYSISCSHCTSIKETIFTLADGMSNLYFFKYSPELKLSQEDMNTLIGVSEFEDLFINGTPSLFQIKNSTVTLAVAGGSKVIDTLFEDYNSKVVNH